ncbi:nuclear transport factor 2 family protein [Chryseobacterium sp. PTM-20240506]|uniref:nuclear transport factor 2 family protein n=1 Tax=unclassified Chryseobacterium TaxID=2593645 RepID=UPI0023590D0E|nr:nuclear transport factor 2 family protein [Chryseobacterium sp. B21-037]MDC8104755.1 nuclear transport factor 2 family protein [Chryseobacterium sp. B21-037]
MKIVFITLLMMGSTDFLSAVRSPYYLSEHRFKSNLNMDNKTVLEKANLAIAKGDYEGFLSYCTDDTQWTFVGEQVLKGKEEVRKYMAVAYTEPPEFKVEKLVAENDYVVAIGRISMKNKEGKIVDYSYCDVWRFRDGKMAELKAFVIEKN